jgi:predicted dehydrogenase
MTTHRVAVVGLSPISSAPAEPAPEPVLGMVVPHPHLAAWAAMPGVEVVAVCDIAPERLAECGREWGRRFPNAVRYADHRSMLAEARPDLLTVATPDHRHAGIVLDAVAAGVRGIFCEKPIATTLAEADAMVAACAGAGVPLLINHSRRGGPSSPRPANSSVPAPSARCGGSSPRSAGRGRCCSVTAPTWSTSPRPSSRPSRPG